MKTTTRKLYHPRPLIGLCNHFLFRMDNPFKRNPESLTRAIKTELGMLRKPAKCRTEETCNPAVKEVSDMVVLKPIHHRDQHRNSHVGNMTPRQKSLYWNTWNNVRKILVEKGWACSVNLEDIRHDLTEKALGYAKSSNDLTNEEFDKVLVKFWSVSLPVGLNEQLNCLDQPTTHFLCQAYHLIDRTGEVEDSGKISYLEALCNRVVACTEPQQLNDGQRRAVIATLTYHALRARNRRRASFTHPSTILH